MATLHFVYMGVNASTREVYFGVSQHVERRINGAHCIGGTVALRHWVCGTDQIRWYKKSVHPSQASAVAHRHERTYQHRLGFKVIRTAGK
jgi:predicted GIY-YIG superfamily endonuclease